MPLDAIKNLAKGTLSTGYNSSATSIVLTTGHGARFPAAPFNAIWWNSTDYPDPSDDPNVEFVRVTGISSDTFTVTRGQESITATAKNTAGKTYKLVATVTAKTWNTDLAALLGWQSGALSSSKANIAGVTTPTAIATATIPANTLGTNRAVKMECSTEIEAHSGSAFNLTIRVKYGSTTLYADVISIPNDNSYTYKYPFYADIILVGDGATNAQRLKVVFGFGPAAAVTTGYGDLAGSPVVFFNPNGGGSSAEDSTTQLDLKLELELGTANAAHVVTTRLVTAWKL